MDEEIASVEGVVFDFEEFMQERWSENKYEICKFYLRGSCGKGLECPNRHCKVEKEVVCKHWLRGLCKKGSQCEFLHEYNMKKMPECFFFSNYGECSNGDDCPFLHIDPKSKIKECTFYNKGFCKHGPRCKDKHIKKVACPFYLCGFCPEGPNCKFGHPKFDIVEEKKGVNEPRKHNSMENIRCFKCQQFGHIAAKCTNKPAGNMNPGGGGGFNTYPQQQPGPPYGSR